MGLLGDILAQKAREVDALRASAAPARRADTARDVRSALARPDGVPLRLIAEIKFRSPSAGPLSRALSAADRAAAYQMGGAAMVSVLTDGRWFDGSLADLREARERTTVPVLCKEFVIDPLQIEHAAAAGADAVLIIVRCVADDAMLERLVAVARERDVEPLVEVVSERELERALEAGACIIGVNARDLDALEMDRARAARVLAAIPSDRIAIHLSGLRTGADTALVARSRADAALIGEALMRKDDPASLLAELTAGAAAPAGKN